MSAPGQPQFGLAHRLMGQGTLLFAGFATAQACSFARNAILGHWLAKGDFGVAAMLTLTLQLLEILSDLAADRLIVQDADGDDPRLMATLHSVLAVRGVLLALVLVAFGQAIAGFFAMPDAAWALQTVALVPLIRGFLHLDMRRRQRQLDNRAFLTVEAVPQVMALGATVPALLIWPGYDAVVAVALVQAASTVALSHMVAGRSYGVGLDRAVLRRLVAFSWPIWLSAIPLIAVYQGDRILVGRYAGIEALAGFSAAFMLAMVPGLLAAKVAHALMLPLLAEVRGDPARFAERYRAMVEAVTGWSAAYLAGFVIAGGAAVEIAFGAQYAGLGAVAGWLASMWALRMVQAVPGMALMTYGDTRPLLTAGVLRALALLPAGIALATGAGLEAVAAAGVAGEVASLGWLVVSLERHGVGLGRALAIRTVAIPIVGAAALALAMVVPAGWSLLAMVGLGGIVALAAAACVLFAMPGVRRAILRRGAPGLVGRVTLA